MRALKLGLEQQPAAGWWCCSDMLGGYATAACFRCDCQCVQKRLGVQRCIFSPEVAGVQDAAARPLQQEHHRSLHVDQNSPDALHFDLRTWPQFGSVHATSGPWQWRRKSCLTCDCSIRTLRTKQWQASSGVTLMVAAAALLQGGASRSTVVSPTGSAMALSDSAGHLSCTQTSTRDVDEAPTAEAAARQSVLRLPNSASVSGAGATHL